jgi:hypothetical protein
MIVRGSVDILPAEICPEIVVGAILMNFLRLKQNNESL